MTDSLSVDVQQLVNYGRARYEDAAACEGLRLYLRDVASVPPGAWGTLPWSDDWQKGWDAARTERAGEAKTIRDKMENMGSGLLQVAANYSKTDIELALDFSRFGYDVQPFATAAGGPRTPHYRPGGTVPSQYADRDGGPGHTLREYGTDVQHPSSDPRWERLHHETVPMVVYHPDGYIEVDVGESSFSLGKVPNIEYLNAEQDAQGHPDGLSRFIVEHLDTLLHLESAIDAFGSGHKKPLSDILVHAWRCSPSVIDNRAELLLSVGRAYDKIGKDMAGDTNRLTLWWQSPASDAFQEDARLARDYVGSLDAAGSVAHETTWLADEGKRAAKFLRDLRAAYADLGHKHINDLINALEKYRKDVESVFASCSSPEKALLAAIDAFVAVLVDREKRANDDARDIIAIDRIVYRDQPDMGTRKHGQIPFPSRSVSAGSWRDSSGWVPNPKHP